MIYKIAKCDKCDTITSPVDEYMSDSELRKELTKMGWGVCDNTDCQIPDEHLCSNCTYEGFGT